MTTLTDDTNFYTWTQTQVTAPERPERSEHSKRSP